ncbi:group III truncated hemoglobin [Flavitalea flava]
MELSKKDIESRQDVQRLIDSFYAKVRMDGTIGYIFNDIARVDWEHHLPIMYDFWEGVLFQKTGYSGNPMVVHNLLNQKSPLRKAHFDQWKKLFLETIGENFEGEKAELARQRAVSIATMMQLKIAGNP